VRYKFDLLLTNIAALTNKSNALDRLGNHRQAIQYFDKVFAIDHRNIIALINKGLALVSLKIQSYCSL
jgi:tetratricopeptide (TPR) repeat protein